MKTLHKLNPYVAALLFWALYFVTVWLMVAEFGRQLDGMR